MKSYNTVAFFELPDIFSCFFYCAGYLMPQHQRYFMPAVPLHDIRTTDTAGFNAHKQFIISYIRYGQLLKPYVRVAVIHCCAHGIKPFLLL